MPRLAVAVLAVGVLAVGVLAPVPAAQACAPPDAPTTYVDDLALTFRPDRAVYRRGQAVTVRITAQRVEPVPDGLRPVPADVDLRVLTPGGGELGRIVFTLPASGARTGRWRIPGGVPTGPVQVRVRALHKLVPSTECYGALVYERGLAEQERYLTITR